MPISIIVHGGAGALDADRIPRCRMGCELAARAGHAVLERGGSALDAVEAAVRVLEDDPEFNAGYGAVLNRDGAVEVDAALFDGSLRGGGVGAVPWMRHPITLARRVLEDGQHLLLVGDGAVSFARDHGMAPELPAAMITDRTRARWEKERMGRARPSATGDTVGALARDASGRIAAGSSTGGISFKHPGRVGDSPIPGAGLYALDGSGAATATGHGESILRVMMCKVAVDAMGGGKDAMEGARAAVAELDLRTKALGGNGGIITMTGDGNVGHSRSADVMPWAAVVDGKSMSGN